MMSSILTRHKYLWISEQPTSYLFAATDKVNSQSVTMRFCLDNTNATHPPSTSSYFAPMVADRLHVRAEEIMGSYSIGKIWNGLALGPDLFSVQSMSSSSCQLAPRFIAQSGVEHNVGFTILGHVINTQYEIFT